MEVYKEIDLIIGICEDNYRCEDCGDFGGGEESYSCEDCEYGEKVNGTYECLLTRTEVCDWPYPNLSKECSEHENCEGCRFYLEGCILCEKPCHWNL